MRQALVNENTDLATENRRYVMRITGNDHEGQDQLGNFIDPEATYPGPGHHVAAAVDRRRRADVPAHRARPARRVDDRVQADPRPRHAHPRGHPQVLLHAAWTSAVRHSHFADPDFDGEPVQIYEPDDDDPVAPPDDEEVARPLHKECPEARGRPGRNLPSSQSPVRAQAACRSYSAAAVAESEDSQGPRPRRLGTSQAARRVPPLPAVHIWTKCLAFGRSQPAVVWLVLGPRMRRGKSDQMDRVPD